LGGKKRITMKSYFSLLLPLFLSWFIFQLPSDTDWQSKVSPSLLLQATAGETVEFLVVLKEQADLSGAAFLSDKNQKGRWVFRQLQATARKTQQPVIALIEQANAPVVSFVIANAIHTRGELPLMEEVARHPAVAAIQPNPWTRLDPAEIDRNAVGLRDMIEWGVDKIDAELVWELDIRGEGVVVGGQDTGVEWEHPSLVDQYRGWDGTNADHNYNWHDAISEISPLHEDTVITPDLNRCGLATNIPCDDLFHGTYTLSIAVGDDGDGNQVGVAPAAKWIACRNMERGYGSPASYIDCFEWFLAPTDTMDMNPDPTKAPHVIVNSWGCPTIEGCNEDNWALMEQVVNNLRAAGIVVVASAGNNGPGCNTINTPAAMFEGSFTVGSTRSNDNISSFSSRGLVSADGSLRMKPNVVAPGSSIRGASLNGNYRTASGTSAAAPHVAGAVALVIAANPDLAGQVELIETILEETAVPLFMEDTCNMIPGTVHPNPIFGYGRIDALAAVQEALDLVSSTEEKAGREPLQVFPNPTTGKTLLSGENISGRATVLVFNAQGQVVRQQQQVLFEEGGVEVDLSNLSPGMYYYQLKVEETIWSGKLIRI
jgi:serine protease AprX